MSEPVFHDPDQLTVFDVPHARNEDPNTSHISAHLTEAVEGTTTSLRPRTTKHIALRAIVQAPRTANEVVVVTGRRGIWKRVSDLKNAGLIEAVGTRPDPETDRPCLVWAANEHGVRVLSLLERGEIVRL
jgi:hypothetical protein